jgi:hypothetical protein
MVTVPGMLSGVLSRAEGLHDAPGGVDVVVAAGGTDAGDGLPGSSGQVGQPVGTRGGKLAGVGEQDADVAVGLVTEGAGGTEGGQHGVVGLPGGVHGAEVACWDVHGVTALEVQSRHSPSERGM